MPASLAIISEEEKFLLVQRRDMPVWVIPGGGIEPGEDPSEAAKREALEETGLEVEITAKLGTFSKKNWLTDETHVFVARPAGGALCLGPESRDLVWFTEMPQIIPPPHRAWIELALEGKENLEMPVPEASYRLFCKACLLHPMIMVRFLLSRCGIHFNGS